MKNYILAAEIVAAHGILGEVRANIYANGPWVFDNINEIKITEDIFVVDKIKTKKNQIIFKLSGVDTVEAATKFVGKKIYIDKDKIEIAEDEFFIEDLIGLLVVDIDSGEEYGIIKEVIPNPANDIYLVKGDKKEYMIPAALEIVPKISLSEKKVYIRPIEGLLDDEN